MLRWTKLLQRMPVRKIKQNFRSGGVLPMNQTAKMRQDTVNEVLSKRMISSKLQGTSRFRKAESKIFSQQARMEKQGMQANKTFALQGLGDLEPLSSSANFGLSEATLLKYESKEKLMRYEAPPAPYTALASRKLAEGKLWPSAPEPSNLTSTEVQMLRHEKNLSPSAKTFSTHVEYYLRRNLKACPAHISERIDFAELIIKECIASRRSKCLYIVWSTVHPGSRFEIEPHLLKLDYWVRRLIMRYIKNRPNIPSIKWIYDTGALQRELPRDLRDKLEAQFKDQSQTLEERVKYLKSLDSLNVRMKDIPWFMPYLWVKDKKMQEKKQIMSDFTEVEKRKKETFDAKNGDPKPSFVS